MLNRKDDIPGFIQLGKIWQQIRSILPVSFVLLILTVSSSQAQAQFTSIDNSSGAWTDLSTWASGSLPGVSGISDTVSLYGNVSRFGDLDFSTAPLFVYDTLIIYGNLSFGNNANLVIGPGAILIVRGDYLSGNQVEVSNSGYMVVTGNWEMDGSPIQGSFDNDGLLYILDPTPDLKTGPGYEDFTCSEPVDSCQQYGETELLSGPIEEIFLAGSFDIKASGPLTFCDGDSVLLSAIDTASNYQWYRDDVALAGETDDTLEVRLPGDYHVTFKIAADSFALEAVTVDVFPIPVISVLGADPTGYCEGSAMDTLVGDPAGGEFLAGAGFSILGQDSALFDPSVAGTYDIYYAYIDPNGCIGDTVQVTLTVHPLPVADILGADPAGYCEGSASDTLTGNFAPEGQFFGGGIADQGDGTGVFLPSASGTYDVSYAYEDANGCRDTSITQVTVHPLSSVQIGTYDTIWDVSDPAFPIAGTPVGGLFSGNGVSGFTYDPAVAGVGYDTVVYTYTNAFSCENSDTIIFEIRNYDFREGARILDDLDGWCSAEAAYNTSGATPDQPQPACLAYGPNVNRWFMFRATTEQLRIQVKTGGSEGTAARPMLALFDTLGNELACQIYYDTYSDLSLSYIGVTPGEWYYLSVDNRYTGNSGTFTLCLDDEVDYDFREGAIVVPHTNDWVSPEAAYTTDNATPDGFRPGCWSDGPTSNRWFTFTALTSNVTVDLLVGGSEGSMTRPSVALLNEAGQEVACGRYISTTGDVRIGSDTLTIGNRYYIMVDHQSGTGNRGTFTLAVDDEVDYDFKAGAIELPHTGYYRSADAEFTTVQATGDVPGGSCWPHGTTYSRWFTFEATTDEVVAEVLTGGFDGDLRRAYIMLLDTTGNELACMRYSEDYSDLRMAYKGLTPGAWYYLVVDNHENSGYCGTFTLTLDNTVGYDYRAGAYEITDIDNWCSAEAEFTTLNASPDETAGSCWPTGPSFNRWFTFEATTNEVLVQLRTGGDDGDLRRALVALWDASGNEIACGRYSSDLSDVSVASASLVPGETYYISVDNYYTTNPGYRGTFSLCVRDEVDYDFPEGAIVLNDLNNWCSADAVYTTIDASPDGMAGSCWPNGPSFNRWFTFQATTSEALVRVRTGGAEGTLRRVLVALYDTSFNEVACNSYTSDYSDVAVGSSALVPGEWYFIAVDNYYTTNPGYRGSFSLCITDAVDYDFREGAHVLSDISNWCSAEQAFSTEGATADGTKPGCWPTDPAFDRWFVFQATGPEVMFTVKTGGDEGTIRRAYAALYDTLGNELACQRYTSDNSDVSIGYTSLVPGEWYYLTVDNYYTTSTGYRGSFTLCANDVVDYDYKEGAIELTDIDNWCSPNQAYTTEGASADRSAGSCWPHGPTYNRWFRFQATSAMVLAQVRTGGDEGTLRRPYIALWDESDNELACSRYTSDSEDLVLGYTSLTPGNWYYLSVDNHENSGYCGSFALCIDDTVDYDFPQGAHIISDIREYCSADQAFSTVGASPDGPVPACWTDGPGYNRWFAFQATVTGELTVNMKTGGDEGTLRYPMLALYDTLFNEIACKNRSGAYDDIELTTSGLIPGEWYFIAADNRDNTAYRGTFTLCTDDALSYDFRDGAIELTDTDNWCSDYAVYTTVSATPDESVGSCWQNGPNYNRWFRFQAASTDISIQVRIAGIEGDINRALVSLWDSTLNEIECQQWFEDNTDTEIFSQGLTPGEWYFISVDNATGGRTGTFTLCITDNLENDFRAGAITLSDLNEWCSERSFYTNSIATSDELPGSCWTGAENDNVWFRFNATSTKATLRIHTGADSGMMVNPQAAVFDAAGTEITCAGPLGGQGELVLLPTGMTIGDWYYVAVDDDGTSGTFTICVDDTIDYDYPQGAFEISDPAGWCSPDAAFSNSVASTDTESGTCWGGSNFRNVWFRFTAPANTFRVEIKTDEVFGTLDRQQFAIFDENMNEIACRGPDIVDGILLLETASLIPGEDYFIAVDNGDADGGNAGSFTICTDTILSYDYLEGAIELSHNYCSPDAAYTLLNSTADEVQASCWGGAELTNVWFRFQATTPYVTVSLKSGDVYGNLRRGQMAIWNQAGDEVACAPSEILEGTLLMRADTLSIGHWYYIAVDVDETQSNDRIGSFSLCLEDALDFDFKTGAYLIPHDYGCSGDAAFSNALATADEVSANCWSNSNGLDNVWFTFIATTPFAHARVRTGSVYGSMDYPQVAIWNEAGEEVACIGRTIREGTLNLMTDTLTVGKQYWISIDDDSRDGTFSFCLADELDYDYRIGARTIPHDYGCSGDGAFSNFQATADENQGSCWEGTENKNVWFRFQAMTTAATVTVKTGSVYGSMDRQQVALWNESGVEVGCTGPLVGEGNIELVVDTLTIGNWYYISVDDNSRSGSFSLCLEDQLTYDYRAGAEIIAHDLGCSPDAAYSNYLATPDESQGSCWEGSENKNVWFTFTANAPYLTFKIKTGSIYGSMNYAQASLWNAAGDEIACLGPVVYEGTSTLSCDTLTPGTQYWISVDDNNRSGSFTICSDDQPTFNFKAGAIELPHNNGCSGDAEYTNMSATADENMGSCWSGTENKNVWFKFLATTPNVTVRLRNDNVYGSLDYPQMALWNEAGEEVACLGRTTRHGEFYLGIDTLSVGSYYYVSVDDDEDAGSFTLCLDDDVNFDFFGGAIEVAHDEGCSGDAVYSNYFASPDRSQGSCWSGTENKNVWFRFQALSTGVTVTFKNGPIYGSLDYVQAALWDASGNELACLGRTERESSVAYLSYEGLTPGDYYYVSVDDDEDAGSFTICFNDESNYDYKQGAFEITNPVRWCSSDAQFNNLYATFDEERGSCWEAGADKNVWFKFTAISGKVQVALRNGTVYGDMRELQVAVWNENGDELACDATTSDWTDLEVEVDTLTPGNTYYISVDDGDRDGSFSLCVNADPLDAELTGTDVSCYGAADGTVTVTASGGSGAGYTYLWQQDGTPLVDNTPMLTGLQPAVYQVTVTDIGNPSDQVILSYTVEEDPPLSLSLARSNETCPGDADGTVTATAGGGSGLGFIYAWFRNDISTGAGGPSITGLDAAEYKVVVTDAGAPVCTIKDSIDVLTLNVASTGPTGISITNNDVCQGTPKVLAVLGGSLGTGAVWRWYLDNACTLSAGPDGPTLTVDPADTTVYWVRAEGICNTTTAVFDTVFTGVPSIAPVSASVNRNNLCPGDGNITLSYSGGLLGDGATAEWYSDAAYTTPVGSGNDLTLPAPMSDQTYYVRFEGDCNITSGVSVGVITKTLSTDPTGVTITNNNTCQGNTKTLTVTGGTLGTNANWVWSTDPGFSSTFDSGVTINVDPPSTSTYYVRAEGDCNTTANVSQVVTVSDLVDPVITTCATNRTINADVNCEALMPDLTPEIVATDNCDPSPVVSQVPLAGAVLGPGTVTATITVTDDFGNSAECYAVVTVLDNAPPVISDCPSDITVTANDEYCGNTVTWTEPTVTDNCTVTLNRSHAPGNFFAVGTTTVTYTAEDGAGNVATCSFDVIVQPASTPVISGNTNVCTPVNSNYSTALLAGKTYLWTVTGGTITGADNGSSVDVMWTGSGAGNVVVEITSGSGCSISNDIDVMKSETPVVGDIESDFSLTRNN